MKYKSENLIIDSCIITAVTITLYAYYLINNKGFFWDDGWAIVENTQIRSLSYQNLKSVFTTIFMAQYSPVNTLMYCLIYYLFGLDPFVFHLVNILIHVINSILVYIFLLKLFNAETRSVIISDIKHINIKRACFFTALMFAVSPMQVESVGWVSASKILLYSFWFLLGFISYINYHRSGKKWWLLLCYLSFLLAYGSKEQAVLFPVSLLLIEVFINKTLVRKGLFTLAPFFLLALILGLISIHIQQTGFYTVFEHEYYPLWQRLIMACFVLVKYIFKIFLPIELGHNYHFPMSSGTQLPIIYYFYVLSVAAGVYFLYSVYKNVKFSVLLFGVVFFVVNVSLTLHIIPLGRSTILAERYIYLSAIGAFLVPNYYLQTYISSLKNPSYGKFLNLVACGYVIVFIIVTFLYLNLWNAEQ